ncbi:uncharacterized protein LOC119952384 [Scyliorhinus canicula]|uniref:uncharacterized protein LOC119952384 n=1 Tax=Scyliorhinus canicula TaxID=7830 RepID=UPI0018F36448|nr:uncharacterized protein LOC119952384 [Scyliorhinus canicula]
MVTRLLLLSFLLVTASVQLRANVQAAQGSARRNSRSPPVYHVEKPPIAVIEEDYPSSDEEHHWGVTVYSVLKKREDTIEKLQEIINSLQDKCQVNFELHPAKKLNKKKPTHAVLEIYFETPKTKLFEEKPTHGPEEIPIGPPIKEVIVKKPRPEIPIGPPIKEVIVKKPRPEIPIGPPIKEVIVKKPRPVIPIGPPIKEVIVKKPRPEIPPTSVGVTVIEQWPEAEPTETQTTAEKPTTATKEPTETQTTAEKPTTATKAIQFVTPKKKRTKEKPTHKPTPATNIENPKKKRIKEKPTSKSKPEPSKTQGTEETRKAMRVITRKKIPIEERPTIKSIPEVHEEELILEEPPRATNAIRFVKQGQKTIKKKPLPEMLLPETPFPEIPLHESIPDMGFVSPEMESADIKSEGSTIAPIPDLGFVSPNMVINKKEHWADGTAGVHEIERPEYAVFPEYLEIKNAAHVRRPGLLEIEKPANIPRPGILEIKKTAYAPRPGLLEIQKPAHIPRPGYPEIEIAAPGRRPGYPEIEIAAPGRRPGFPEIEIAAPGRRPGFPEIEIAAPGRRPGFPEIEIPAPIRRPGFPEIEIPVPGRRPGYPEIEIAAPGRRPGFPEIEIPAPGRRPGYPEIEIAAPGRRPGFPEIEIAAPRRRPGLLDREKPAYVPRSGLLEIKKPAYIPRPGLREIEKPAYVPRPGLLEIEKPAYVPRPGLLEVEKPAYVPRPGLLEVEKTAHVSRPGLHEIERPAYIRRPGLPEAEKAAYIPGQDVIELKYPGPRLRPELVEVKKRKGNPRSELVEVKRRKGKPLEELIEVKKPKERIMPELVEVLTRKKKVIPELVEVKKRKGKIIIPELIEVKKPKIIGEQRELMKVQKSKKIIMPEVVEIRKPKQRVMPELVEIKESKGVLSDLVELKKQQERERSGISIEGIIGKKLSIPIHSIIPEQEYNHVLLQDPDEKKIQEVLENFQEATEEDQRKHGKKRKGKRLSRSNELFDELRDSVWPQKQRDRRDNILKYTKGKLSELDDDHQELTNEDDDVVEERLDELENSIMPDTSEIKSTSLDETHDVATGEEAFEKLMEELEPPDYDDTSENSEVRVANLNEILGLDSSEEVFDKLIEELEPYDAHAKVTQTYRLPHKFTDEEMVQKSINKLQSEQSQGRKLSHAMPDVEVTNEEKEEVTEPEIEFIEENVPRSNQNESKQSLRDMIEDLIAASLIAVFVILALIAMFYTVSFVRAKEKEKSPTITIIESGSPDGTRKYTVCPTRKQSTTICHSTKFKPSRRQMRQKHQKDICSDVSSESSCRSTETITLPPPRIISTCPQPLPSHVSRAYSPRPLSPYPVCPCSRSSQLPAKPQELIPSPHQQYSCKLTTKPEIRETILPPHQDLCVRSAPRVMSSYDVGSPISERDIHQASRLLPTSRMISSYDVGTPILESGTDHQASRLLSTPRRLSYDIGSPVSERDIHQASRLLPTSRMISSYDVGTPILESGTDHQASRLLSTPRRLSYDVGSPVSERDIHQASRLLSTPRISSYDVGSAILQRDTLSDHQASHLLPTSRMMSSYDVGSPISERDVTFSDHDASQILSTSQMAPTYDVAPSISARAIHPGSVSDKGLVRSIHRDTVPAQLLSQSAPFLPTRSLMKQQTTTAYPSQLDRRNITYQDDSSHYPLSILRTNAKSMSSMPEPDESQKSDSLKFDSLDRSSRSAYISDVGDIVSVESYVDPTSSISRPIVSSQHVVPETLLSSFTPQSRHVTPSLSPEPISVSFAHPPRYVTPPPQRPRSQSVNIPVAPLQSFHADGYRFQGNVSSGDLGPRSHYIPKGSDMGIHVPEIDQSSMHSLIHLPQGVSQSRLLSQPQIRSPTLSHQQLSNLASPSLHKESALAYIPSSQHIPAGERGYRSVTHAPQCQFRPQRRTVSSPALAGRSFVQQQVPPLSYGDLSAQSIQDLSKEDSILMAEDTSYPLAGVSQSPSLHGWMSTDSPSVGEMSRSNIPSRADFASISPDNLQSRVHSFDPSMTSSSIYSPSRHLSFFPSYQSVTPGSPHESFSIPSEAEYLGSQDVFQSRSPLPKVPPPPFSPSHQSIQQSLSFPSYQPLSPLSLSFLRQPSIQRISTFPPGSLSPRPKDSFDTANFEDSAFLKMSPISQSFIHRKYSYPPASPSFFFSPNELSLSGDNVFTYPDGSQHLASTPRDSRTLAVNIDPDLFHSAITSPSSASSESTAGTHQRSFEDSFLTSSDSASHVQPSAKDKQFGPPSDYSINEIGSDISSPYSSHYYTARSYFNDSSDHTNSD